MSTLLLMAAIVVGGWIFFRVLEKQPILPWKEKKHTNVQLNTNSKNNKTKKKKHEVEIEQEPNLFEELFSDVRDVTTHMIRFHDNSFTMIAEVDPVNYFLKNQDEQEAIDITVESWTATLNYPVGIYLQNRFIDVSEPIELMAKAMKESEDLNEAALSYGQAMIDDILSWQRDTPRYETKRYLIFTHKIKANDITADSEEELETKVMEKAFAELMRRLTSARNQLRKADITVNLVPTEGIYELLYYTFNRRKALKHRFKDLVEQEKNALYITAEQTDNRIDLVKEAIEQNEAEMAKETATKKETA
ncbi:hypothetical protein M3612_19820 [Niallia taxi]|uniref:hypothetical protein n=1 Tax=Niallia taxi TaxID=2499688 RepID=UPI00203E94A3|nr:hypothetical protein [Niallia taxi]MCM3216737.1 hypothetical protein [Niallia taxi]